jgi:isoleucyl-tRNA synthetase
MRLVERLVRLGRTARDEVQIGVRQPLAQAQFVVRNQSEADAFERLSELIASELNVKKVSVLRGAEGVVEYKLNPLPSKLGKKFGKDFPVLQKVLREGDAEQVRGWAQSLLKGQHVSVEVNGQTFKVTPDEVEVKQNAAEGFAVAEEGGYLAALDTHLTEALIVEGLAREVVRRIQTTRKDADFDIEDKINVVYNASEKLTHAIEQFSDYIKTETLAVSLEKGEPSNGFYKADFSSEDEQKKLKGETLSIGVKRI